MIAMIQADLLKLRRRRGLWWTCVLLPFAVGSLIVILTLTDVVDSEGGARFIEDTTQALAVIGAVLAVLVGARQGSDEHAAGTIRYQLLTGVPRWKLYVSKLAVLVIAAGAIAASGAVPAILGGLAIEPDPGQDFGGADLLSAGWNVFLPCLVYGAIAFGVGALMRSTGPAIAVALVLNLVGINIVGLFTLIDDWFRHLVLNLGVDRLTFNDFKGEEDEVSLGAAIAMVLAWAGLFIGLGWARLRKLEA